jgi:hypothetical protein
MRVIGTLSGLSIVRAAAEEIGPPEGILVAELVTLLIETYHCQPATAPAMPPGISPQGAAFVTLQNGKLEQPSRAIAIAQIQLRNDGMVISTQSTNNSDIVLRDISSLLNNKLNFKLSVDNQRIYHASSVVVEFDKEVEEFISGLARAGELVSKAISKEQSKEKAMLFKRLSFGYEEGVGSVESGLDAIDRLDFLLERRASHPFDDNRYFSSAPLSTDAHIAVLKQLESIRRSR